MSQGTIENIIIRIKAATKESPIAVFKDGGKLNAMFAATVKTQDEIISNHTNLVGVFTGFDVATEQETRAMREKLRKALGLPAKSIL